MERLKTYEVFESDYVYKGDNMRDDIHDILLDLEDIGLKVDTTFVVKNFKRVPNRCIEVYISRQWGAKDREIPGVVNPEGGYPGNLLFWYEIKDSIVRLTNWYYSQSKYKPIDKSSQFRWEKDDSPLRFFGSGIEMFIGFSEEKDFDKLGDFTSFTSFRLMVRI